MIERLCIRVERAHTVTRHTRRLLNAVEFRSPPAKKSCSKFTRALFGSRAQPSGVEAPIGPLCPPSFCDFRVQYFVTCTSSSALPLQQSDILNSNPLVELQQLAPVCCNLFRAMSSSRVTTPLSGPAKAYLANLEKRWSGSLHLTMLATPLRKCIVTSKILPTSLLVQLKAISPSFSYFSYRPAASSAKGSIVGGSRVVMLPDQILHPSYVPKKVGKGVWLTLDPRIFAQLEKKAAYKVLNSKATLVKGTERLIAKQLGERVVQEVMLLRESLG